MSGPRVSRFLLVAACFALVACSEAGVEPSTTASPADAATTTAEPTAEPSPSATASASPAEPVEHSVGWSVPFTITTPAAWEPEDAASGTYTFRAALDRWLVFNLNGPDTVEAWTDQLTSAQRFVVSEPAPVEIGGAPGVVFDLSLAEGESETQLFGDPAYSWVVSPNRPNRVWILGVDGVPVMIVTDAPERAFDSWIATVEEALATLEWTE